MISLFKQVIFRFHVNFPGCILHGPMMIFPYKEWWSLYCKYVDVFLYGVSWFFMSRGRVVYVSISLPPDWRLDGGYKPWIMMSYIQWSYLPPCHPLKWKHANILHQKKCTVSKRHITSLHATQFQDPSSNLDEGIPTQSIFHATVPFYKLQSAFTEIHFSAHIWSYIHCLAFFLHFQTTWCCWDDPLWECCTHAGAPSGEKRAAQEEIIEEFLDGRLVARLLQGWLARVQQWSLKSPRKSSQTRNEPTRWPGRRSEKTKKILNKNPERYQKKNWTKNIQMLFFSTNQPIFNQPINHYHQKSELVDFSAFLQGWSLISDKRWDLILRTPDFWCHSSVLRCAVA